MSNTINEALAKQAKEAMSFDSYKPGSATAAYNAACAEAREIAEAQKKRVDPMYHDKIDGLLASYCRRLAENINSRNRIGASCPSIMIAGGSNFPRKKKGEAECRHGPQYAGVRGNRSYPHQDQERRHGRHQQRRSQRH